MCLPSIPLHPSEVVSESQASNVISKWSESAVNGSSPDWLIFTLFSQFQSTRLQIFVSVRLLLYFKPLN